MKTRVRVMTTTLKILIATIGSLFSPALWLILEQFIIFAWKTLKTLVIIALQLGIKGIPSILLAWLLISGSGLFIIGLIIKSATLKIIGATIYAFWLTPIPLNLFIIAVALVIQRHLFRDKTVTVGMIKDSFRKGFKKERKNDAINHQSSKRFY